ncbi:uncharacterized protein BDR25DRAFT_350215 [Lindgomyces ingoldianus]|uniref:Uncharacterized protein n=1 Tax=Lindgomyces ingoldianus TaxID=673940 RepID=A0ACB6RC81_9PLEO|nr:uncharacterized protein BDR25DRAFT_350215 [Lindgomyces ingoldianus]KAF2475940.1 hypothetical protein BDR25DRAFT_350215 [Lindgomyces ingoldianus]
MEESRQLAQRLKCLPLELRRFIYEMYWAVNLGWLPWIHNQRGNETVKEPGRLHLVAPTFFGNEIACEALQTAYETTECTFLKESIPVDELCTFLRSKMLPLRLVLKTFLQRVKIHLFLKELLQIGDLLAFLLEKTTPLSVSLLLDTKIIVPCLVCFLQNDFICSILGKLSKKETWLMLLNNCNKLHDYDKFLKYEGLGAKPRTDDVITLGTDYWEWMNGTFAYSGLDESKA